MRRLLPPLVLLLAAVAVFLVLRPAPGPVDVADPGPAEPAPEAAPAPGLSLEGAAAPRPAPEPAPAGPRVPTAIDPRTLPKGGLQVVVAGPDDAVLPTEGVRVHLEPAPGSKAWHATPLLLADVERATWTSDDVPAGPVRVRVTGDHVVETTLDTRVEAGVTGSVRVRVDRAGLLAYEVKLYSGEAPEQVTLTLLDARRQPVRVLYQVRTQAVLTQPRAATSATQGPQGVLLGVPPGRYVLRAVSAAEEYDEREVELAAGQSASVSLSIRQ